MDNDGESLRLMEALNHLTEAHNRFGEAVEALMGTGAAELGWWAVRTADRKHRVVIARNVDRLVYNSPATWERGSSRATTTTVAWRSSRAKAGRSSACEHDGARHPRPA